MNVHTYDKILSIKPSEEVQLWLSLQDHKHLDKKKQQWLINLLCLHKLPCSRCNQGNKYEIMRLSKDLKGR